jgi:hypothetical protein
MTSSLLPGPRPTLARAWPPIENTCPGAMFGSFDSNRTWRFSCLRASAARCARATRTFSSCRARLFSSATGVLSFAFLSPRSSTSTSDAPWKYWKCSYGSSIFSFALSLISELLWKSKLGVRKL